MPIKIPTYKNIEAFFKSNFDLQYLHNIDFNKLFEPLKENFEENFINIYDTEPIYFDFKGQSFPVFIHNNETELFTEKGLISFDVYLNTFLFLSGYLELISDKKDIHSRFPYEASLQKKYSFVEIPVVTIYFELIKELALKRGFKLEAKKIDSPFIFTHDIDQLRSGWYENIIFYKENFSIKSLIEIPKNLITKTFGLKDDYYKGMEEMLQIDETNNIKAISFFISNKSEKDADFYLKDKRFESLLKRCKTKQEIGFHPGYETFKNQDEFEKQKEDLEKFFEQKITKSRQHFLRYDMAHTPYIIEQSGIKEDYTLGFAEHYGFRNGISHSFYLFNFKEKKAFTFLTVPLVFMDVSLTNYTKYSLAERHIEFQKISQFLKNVKISFPTQVSILFHNSVFTEVKYKGLKAFYKKLTQI